MDEMFVEDHPQIESFNDEYYPNATKFDVNWTTSELSAPSSIVYVPDGSREDHQLWRQLEDSTWVPINGHKRIHEGNFPICSREQVLPTKSVHADDV